MIDLDPQCSLSLSTIDEYYWADWLERRGSVANVIASFYDRDRPFVDANWIVENALDRTWDNMPGSTPKLDLLPSHLDLPEYEMRLMAEMPAAAKSLEEFYIKRYILLREALAGLRQKYDYILFDCPPNIYLIARNAIIASDYYLIPTIPDFISCYGISFILEHIRNMQQDVQERGIRSEASCLGILRNRVRHAGHALVREHEEQSLKLKRQYDTLLMENSISDRIGVAELLGKRQNLYQDKHERYAEIRREFANLVKAVVKIIDR